MGRLGLLAVLFSASACSYATQSSQTVEPNSDVGRTGNIQYSHDTLGNNKHLVTITAAPGMLETDGSIEQRIQTFATRFAARTCPASYEFLDEPGSGTVMAKGFMKRTMTFVFLCMAAPPLHD